MNRTRTGPKQVLLIIVAFLAANVFALVVSQLIITSQMTRELHRNTENVSEDFAVIMADYVHTFRLFEEMLTQKMIDVPDPDQIESFLKSEDARLAEIEGVGYDGVYLYYRSRYLYSWSTPYSVYADSGYDATKRPWYIGAVAAAGEPHFTSPYPSYANDYMLATISRLQPDGQTVVAYDIKLDKIQEYIRRLDIYGNSLSLACSADNIIVGSSEPLYLGGDLRLSDEALLELNANAQQESDLAIGSAGAEKAAYKAEAAAAFAAFHADMGAFIEKLRAYPETLHFDRSSLSYGYLHAYGDYAHIVIIPFRQIMQHKGYIVAVALVIVNLLTLLSGSVYKRQLYTRRLRTAYSDLAHSEEKLNTLNAELQEAFLSERKLTALIQMLNEFRPLAEVLTDMLRSLGEYLHADRVSVYRVEGDDIHQTDEWCSEAVAAQRAPLSSISREIFDYWTPSFLAGESVCVPDVELIRSTHPEEYALAASTGVTGYVASPLLMQGNELYGFICVDNPPPEKIRNIGTLMLALTFALTAAITREDNRLKLVAASFHDAMTGVGNRNAYVRALEKYKADMEAGLDRRSHSAIFCDLNGLKVINDTLGHEAGDRAIADLANGLRHYFRETDIYRTGGDEFVVLCAGMTEASFYERVSSMKAYFAEQLKLSVAAGAVWSDDGVDIEQTVSLADARMYEVKSQRGARQDG